MNASTILDNIDMKWVGIRKSRSDSIFCGYFVEKGKRNTVLYSFEEATGVKTPKCYMFKGKTGKKIIFEEKELTLDFLDEVEIFSKNFRPITPENIISKMGSQNIKEFELFLMLLKLKND